MSDDHQPHPWTEDVADFDDDGFTLDAEGKRIEIACVWCGGSGCDLCGETGLLFATRQDFEEWA